MSFYLTFKDLAEDHKPKMRKGYGAIESELSSSWIGYYCEFLLFTWTSDIYTSSHHIHHIQHASTLCPKPGPS